MNWADKEDIYKVVQGCIKENRKYQKLVYERFYGKMMGVCARYARNSDEAKDILQDGFIKVFANLHKYGGDGSFEGWVRRIIVNTAIDFYRKNKNNWHNQDNEQLDQISDKTEVQEDIEGTYKDISIGDVVNEVQNLSPAYRTVFNLYVMEGYTHQEIAKKLEISEGTSKSNLAKAKRNLKKALEKQLVHE